MGARRSMHRVEQNFAHALSCLVVFLRRGAESTLTGYGVPTIPSWFTTTFLKIVEEVMTLGLPQVCELWLGVSKGMVLVKHLAPNILKTLAVNYCGCQLARRKGWVAPAYHKNEGATLHPGESKFSLHYNGRPHERFGVRVWTWNLGILGGFGEKLVKN